METKYAMQVIKDGRVIGYVRGSDGGVKPIEAIKDTSYIPYTYSPQDWFLSLSRWMTDDLTRYSFQIEVL